MKGVAPSDLALREKVSRRLVSTPGNKLPIPICKDELGGMLTDVLATGAAALNIVTRMVAAVLPGLTNPTFVLYVSSPRRPVTKLVSPISRTGMAGIHWPNVPPPSREV